MPKIAYEQILEERAQAHATRKHLFREIEDELGRPVMSFFTSFMYEVGIDSTDADIIEMILQELDVTNGFAMIISSPGGDGLTAERIIRACRSYSDTNEFWAIVPSMAKSAATMICFGASKILMSPTAELGPVDPQIIIEEYGQRKRFPAYVLMETYDDLFYRATKETGRIEPYLQQLEKYDSRRIKQVRTAVDLSKEITIRALKTGMMEGTSEQDIEQAIQVFLEPTLTKDHARPIYHDEAEHCGLKIEVHDPKSTLWKNIHELYMRTDLYVSMDAMKCIESANHSFALPVFQRKEENKP